MDGSTTDRTSGGESGMRARASEQASRARETVKEEIRTVKDDVERKTADRVNRQKHQIADRMDALVHALDSARSSLRDDGQDQIAGFVGDLGHQLERSTGYLRNNDFHGMVRDMEQLARGNTALFLGSSFVAGVAMGRFLRASEPQPEQTGGELGHGSGPALVATDHISGDGARSGSTGFGGPGELGTSELGGATGTRGAMGASGEGGLIGDSYDSPRRNREDV